MPSSKENDEAIPVTKDEDKKDGIDLTQIIYAIIIPLLALILILATVVAYCIISKQKNTENSVILSQQASTNPEQYYDAQSSKSVLSSRLSKASNFNPFGFPENLAESSYKQFDLNRISTEDKDTPMPNTGDTYDNLAGSAYKQFELDYINENKKSKSTERNTEFGLYEKDEINYDPNDFAINESICPSEEKSALGNTPEDERLSGWSLRSEDSDRRLKERTLREQIYAELPLTTELELKT